MRNGPILTWLADKFIADDDPVNNAIWDRTGNWESWAGGEVDFWWDQPYAEQLMAVARLSETDPVAAFQGYQELAQKGCVHAMIWVGNCYRYGLGTEPNFDKAYENYSLAIDEGSWIATRDMAGLLFDNGNFAECEEYLEEGIEYEFIPAYFWLAFYRIKQSKSRAIYREVKPLLEYAAAEGHPHAYSYLSALKMFGKFGVWEIPQGIRQMRQALREFREYRLACEEA
jgi:TPR repeat protein